MRYPACLPARRHAVGPPFTGTLLCLMVLPLWPAVLDAARERTMEVLPAQATAPAAVVIERIGSEQELREQLRAKNEVVELAAATSRFSVAPTGSFGFIAPQPLGMALVTQSPDLGLERIAPAPNAYEIHKLKDGSGMLVGFIGRDVMPQVRPSNRPKNVRIALYSHASDKAPYIAAVPLIKLMVDRMPMHLDPKQPHDPVMLEMDLQGTANRKSPTMPQ